MNKMGMIIIPTLLIILRFKIYEFHEKPLINILVRIDWYFPGRPLVKNPSCNAGDASSIAGQGTKIPHAAGQLSPGAK